MRLGARWRRGEAPHRGVPQSLHPAIAEQELAHPEASSWTLTWLEGRPRCALDDVALVTLDTGGTVRVESSLAADDDDAEDDDWLN